MARSFNYVKFDTAELARGTERYREYSKELDGIKRDLEKAMDQLVNTYWVGTASTKFKSKIGDDWLDTTRRYCELLDDLTTIMDDVVRTYEGLLEAARRLRV